VRAAACRAVTVPAETSTGGAGMDDAAIEELLDAMAAELQAQVAACARGEPLMIGIQTGGAWVAARLQARLGWPLGTLNIAFYRDDFSRIGMHPRVTPSRLPFDVEDRAVVLVDDVIHTGRTVRAALNEIFDFGRPALVLLAVLFDRAGRELPVQANVTGRRLTLAAGQHAKLTGPSPLALSIAEVA